MKVSMHFMKLLLRLLIFLILVVLMCMLSAILYSAKYWPDVYNYINANITIKHIPTISELELTVIEVQQPTTETDIGTTTDFEYDSSTVDDFDIDSFMADEFGTKKARREIVIEQMKDYIELPSRGIFVDYIFLGEPETTSEESKIIKEVINEEIRNKQTRDKINGFLKGFEDLKKDISDDHTVSEIPMFTKQYYTVNPKTMDNIRKLDETTNKILENYKLTENVHPKILNKDNIPNVDENADLSSENVKHLELITTNDGILVGDDNSETSTAKVYHITTDSSEEDETNEEPTTMLMRDLVDESKLTTRDQDVEMVGYKYDKILRSRRAPENLRHSRGV